MKQKLVIKLSMNGQKSHSKALKIIVEVSGVESVALGEEDKNLIEVVGEGVDAVEVTNLLRKKLVRRSCMTCFLPTNIVYAELISVSVIGEKEKEEKEEEKAKEEQPVVWSYGYNVPQYIIY